MIFQDSVTLCENSGQWVKVQSMIKNSDGQTGGHCLTSRNNVEGSSQDNKLGASWYCVDGTAYIIWGR